MKVYILSYEHWDDSEIRGVYSEEGMKKEKEKFALYGRELIGKIVPDLEERMNSAYARAKEHFKTADASYKEGTKASKSFGKMEMKQGQTLKANAEAIQRELDKYSDFDEQKYCEYYMKKEHLYFDEHYVLD